MVDNEITQQGEFVLEREWFIAATRSSKMGFFKKIGTFAKGFSNAANPYGIGLLTAGGMINRIDVELKRGSSLFEAIQISLLSSSAKYISREIYNGFVEHISNMIEEDKLTFRELALGWCLLTYEYHVKRGIPWGLSEYEIEIQRMEDGVDEAINNLWEDTHLLKHQMKAK